LELAGKLVAKDIRGLMRQLETRLGRIEAAIDTWLENQVEFKELHERLDKVKGLGRISILMLIAFLPELGRVSGKRASALAGLAPFNRDSGGSRGQMHIGGGRGRGPFQSDPEGLLQEAPRRG